MLIDGRLVRANALLDTGASTEFMSQKFVDKHKISCRELKNSVKISTAEGNISRSAHQTVPQSLYLGPKKTSTRFTVMNLRKYDMILGMPYINVNNINIMGGYPTRVTMSYHDEIVDLPIRSCQRQGDQVPHGATIVYNVETFWEEHVRKDEQVYLVVPKQVDERENQDLPGTDTTDRYRARGVVVESVKGDIDTKVEGAEVDDSTRKNLKRLLEENASAFPDDLPLFENLPTHPVKHKIETEPGARIPYRRPYRTSFEDDAVVKETLKYPTSHGLIGPSCSPYASPVLIVPKPDGTKRFCIDFRALNAITKIDRYPLPRIDDLLDQLRGAKYYSRIDLRSGYWQMRIDEEDVEKTSFITKYGTYQWYVMPFGLNNAPSSFQRLVNYYFQPYLNDFVSIYLDDIIIYSKTAEEHLEHLSKILKILKEKQLFGKLSKCDFFKTKIDFLGHVVSEKGVETNPEKVRAIQEWPEPTDLKTLLGLLGICGYYRRFIHKYAEIAKPLTDLLRGKTSNVKIELGPAAREAVQKLKSALSQTPVLRQYDPTLPTEVWTDASTSHHCIGAVLMQDDGDGMRPVTFLSKVLHGPEERYSTYEIELLAVKIALEQWRHYLLPLEFTVRSDHHSLQYLNSMPILNARQARWLNFFAEFRFKQIRYRPGQMMAVPDSLSRRPETVPAFDKRTVLEVSKNPTEDSISVPGTKVVLNLETTEDTVYVYHLNHPPDVCRRVAEMVNVSTRTGEKGTPSVPPSDEKERDGLRDVVKPAEAVSPSSTADTSKEVLNPSTLLPSDMKLEYHDCPDFNKTYKSLVKGDISDPRHKPFKLSEDKKTLLWRVSPTEDWRIAVPKALRPQVLKEYHDTHFRAHAGYHKLLAQIREYFYWPNMKTQIQQYTRTCEQCMRSKVPNVGTYGYPHIMEVPDEPFQVISLDLMSGLPRTKNGHDAVVVFTDQLSKYGIILPLRKESSAYDIAQLYYLHVFRHFGLPQRIISDRDKRFMSKFWTTLYGVLGTTLTPSSPYHPETDGQTERMNRTLTEALRAYVNAKHDDWELYLPSFEFAYNDSINRSTGYAPFELVLSIKPRVPMTINKSNRLPAVDQLAERMSTDVALARDQLLRSRATNAYYRVKGFTPHPFKEGSMVLLSTQNLKMSQPSRKLTPLFVGPFKILRMKGNNAAVLDLPRRFGQLSRTQNVEYLRPYYKRTTDIGMVTEPPSPDIVDDTEEYEVEEILSHRYAGNRLQYLIRWKGYHADQDSWEPHSEIARNCGGKIREYRDRTRTLTHLENFSILMC